MGEKENTIGQGLSLNTIHHGDCLELMKDIPDKSVDMILADLPYGATGVACINTKRNYILIEQEKEYVDIANKRIQDRLSEKTLFS